jgi:hypothetical protein
VELEKETARTLKQKSPILAKPDELGRFYLISAIHAIHSLQFL